MAFIEAYNSPNNSSITFDNIITGKGKGLNILL
jgi:hypothetical protein